MDETVPDTPIGHRKVVTTPPPAATDDADLLGYETVATVPLSHPIQVSQIPQTLTPASQRLQTQPTQIIPGGPAASAGINFVVQVAASSPLGPASSPSRPPLSNLIAPPGTRFRPPARPEKRTPVIDLDDDGPVYRGGSSDDETANPSPDIKPSTFARPTKSPEKIAESPVSGNSSAMDRFKEITSSAMYRPGKRTSTEMGSASPIGVAVKKPRQDGPSRAQPVGTGISSLDDIEDYQIRVKVQRLQTVMRQKSLQACLDALIAKRGDYDDALVYLSEEKDSATPVYISSDDELAVIRHTSPVGAAPAKQQIKARSTIQDKWSSLRMPNPPQKTTPPPEEQKPRRRLIRGPKNRSSSPASSARSDNTQPQRKPGRLVRGQRAVVSSPRSESPEEPIQISDDDTGSDSGEVEDGDRDVKVLRFFNQCDAANLADIAGISEEVAQIVISNRPFRSLDAVRAVTAPSDESKPKTGKGRRAPKPIGDKVVDKCLDMWAGYEAVDSLVAQCEAIGRPIALEMKKWGVDIFGKRDGELEMVSIDTGASHDSGIGTPSSNRSDEDSDGPATNAGSRKTKFISQPSIMNKDFKMKDYQIVGINWLSLLFNNELSCILADDMGLGKTCQVIAFLAHLYERGIKGPHLVVVPASTIENWLREFQKFCPALSVMPYYAGQNERLSIQETILNNLDSINVVVTTYTIAKGKYDASFLRKMNFCVCVYDEGHMLKSSTSVLYEKLIRIPAQFRLLLTGTPLQNNLQELASLLGFILPKVFQERKDDLQYIFANKAKTTDESRTTLLSAQRIERAKSMLKPFVLRRKKYQVIDLPPKISRVEYCEMNDTQKEIYSSQKEEVRQLLADRAAGKRTGNKSANILMKLRQAALHPLLFRRLYDNNTLSRMAKACLKEEKWSQSDPDLIYEDLQPYNDLECHQICAENPNSLGKFALKSAEWINSGKVAKLCDLLSRFKESGDRTLIFSQFTMVMDILELVLEEQHIEFVRLDGRTNVEDRQSILDAFHERTDIPVFLLSTKAGGAGINLACANKVIIFDSSFNPQEDVQAENRAHRVGQNREVEVIRLVTKDTIEEQIYALGQTKLALDQAVSGAAAVGEEGGASSKKQEETGMKMVEDMMLADMEKKDDEAAQK
ncbi:hypothetical protein MPDQ_004238 [Monascus purpureus]|uniref:DNA helicase n=1 Tax=Monascus purpureus TaxID=5098 RepID=A0A507QYI2_MONPU|nr:hypothetical protein MPDQ_004238 [Monascus purpureus]BDD63583.1 hypothetical protein MAP00_008455 [Monascus purpureus]